MPNYYVLFSEELTDLTADERIWLEKALCEPEEMDPMTFECWKEAWFPAGYEPGTDWELWPGFQYTFNATAENTLWVWSEDTGDAENAIDLFTMFLEKYRPQQEYAFSYAFTCSRPIIGGFGGGSVICNEQEEDE